MLLLLLLLWLDVRTMAEQTNTVEMRTKQYHNEN